MYHYFLDRSVEKPLTRRLVFMADKDLSTTESFGGGEELKRYVENVNTPEDQLKIITRLTRELLARKMSGEGVDKEEVGKLEKQLTDEIKGEIADHRNALAEILGNGAIATEAAVVQKKLRTIRTLETLVIGDKVDLKGQARLHFKGKEDAYRKWLTSIIREKLAPTEIKEVIGKSQIVITREHERGVKEGEKRIPRDMQLVFRQKKGGRYEVKLEKIQPMAEATGAEKVEVTPKPVTKPEPKLKPKVEKFDKEALDRQLDEIRQTLTLLGSADAELADQIAHALSKLGEEKGLSQAMLIAITAAVTAGLKDLPKGEEIPKELKDLPAKIEALISAVNRLESKELKISDDQITKIVETTIGKLTGGKDIVVILKSIEDATKVLKQIEEVHAAVKMMKETLKKMGEDNAGMVKNFTELSGNFTTINETIRKLSPENQKLIAEMDMVKKMVRRARKGIEGAIQGLSNRTAEELRVVNNTIKELITTMNSLPVKVREEIKGDIEKFGKDIADAAKQEVSAMKQEMIESVQKQLKESDEITITTLSEIEKSTQSTKEAVSILADLVGEDSRKELEKMQELHTSIMGVQEGIKVLQQKKLSISNKDIEKIAGVTLKKLKRDTEIEGALKNFKDAAEALKGVDTVVTKLGEIEALKSSFTTGVGKIEAAASNITETEKRIESVFGELKKIPKASLPEDFTKEIKEKIESAQGILKEYIEKTVADLKKEIKDDGKESRERIEELRKILLDLQTKMNEIPAKFTALSDKIGNVKDALENKLNTIEGKQDAVQRDVSEIKSGSLVQGRNIETLLQNEQAVLQRIGGAENAIQAMSLLITGLQNMLSTDRANERATFERLIQANLARNPQINQAAVQNPEIAALTVAIRELIGRLDRGSVVTPTANAGGTRQTQSTDVTDENAGEVLVGEGNAEGQAGEDEGDETTDETTDETGDISTPDNQNTQPQVVNAVQHVVTPSVTEQPPAQEPAFSAEVLDNVKNEVQTGIDAIEKEINDMQILSQVSIYKKNLEIAILYKKTVPVSIMGQSDMQELITKITTAEPYKEEIRTYNETYGRLNLVDGEEVWNPNWVVATLSYMEEFNSRFSEEQKKAFEHIMDQLLDRNEKRKIDMMGKGFEALIKEEVNLYHLDENPGRIMAEDYKEKYLEMKAQFMLREREILGENANLLEEARTDANEYVKGKRDFIEEKKNLLKEELDMLGRVIDIERLSRDADVELAELHNKKEAVAAALMGLLKKEKDIESGFVHFIGDSQIDRDEKRYNEGFKKRTRTFWQKIGHVIYKITGWTPVVDDSILLEELGGKVKSTHKEAVQFIKKTDTFTAPLPTGAGSARELFGSFTEGNNLKKYAEEAGNKKQYLEDLNEKVRIQVRELHRLGKYLTVPEDVFENEQLKMHSSQPQPEVPLSLEQKCKKERNESSADAKKYFPEMVMRKLGDLGYNNLIQQKEGILAIVNQCNSVETRGKLLTLIGTRLPLLKNAITRTGITGAETGFFPWMIRKAGELKGDQTAMATELTRQAGSAKTKADAIVPALQDDSDEYKAAFLEKLRQEKNIQV